jgi:hypothetical protein
VEAIIPLVSYEAAVFCSLPDRLGGEKSTRVAGYATFAFARGTKSLPAEDPSSRKLL